MSSLNKGIDKAEVTLKWDPSPQGEPANDLDIIAATYTTDALHGEPDYLVHFDSRSPDGTITLNRDSRTGQGFGVDEAMTLEFSRLAERYGRVVVGVTIQQRGGRRAFGDIPHTLVRILEGYEVLAEDDFGRFPGATAAVVAEFVRDGDGEWQFVSGVRGFEGDADDFASWMGRRPADG
ncbi:TerD family protein [Streptomyces purpurogeneiscleroticus]|uniref:TerD family protein n=1 Tax=Streptomyces purpurogeneiscleroticus TaxID=68259 RepID=UPI001CC0EA05|nr:TerD family protein [Streptomyces purpurogeneiscleroticus]MBZ4019348.1 TerD-family protein [Streptomyces purpurogeneiscleroticus]